VVLNTYAVTISVGGTGTQTHGIASSYMYGFCGEVKLKLEMKAHKNTKLMRIKLEYYVIYRMVFSPVYNQSNVVADQKV
jgi:hypothetical protein